MKDILTNAVIEGLTERVTQLDEKVTEMTKRLAKKEALIAELKAELRSMETREQNIDRTMRRVSEILAKRNGGAK